MIFASCRYRYVLHLLDASPCLAATFAFDNYLCMYVHYSPNSSGSGEDPAISSFRTLLSCPTANLAGKASDLPSEYRRFILSVTVLWLPTRLIQMEHHW